MKTIAQPSEPKKDDLHDHELKHMADTIMQAHEHMADPELMKKLQPHLDKKTKAIKSIAQLKKRAKMVQTEESNDSPQKAD